MKAFSCAAPRFIVTVVTRILAMCFLMGRNPPASVIASIRHHWILWATNRRRSWAKAGDGRRIGISVCYVLHLAVVMALHLADFFIIQAAITIAVHLLEHGDDATVKLGFVDHAVGVKIEHLKPFILAAGEFFKTDHTIIVDVELFCHELAALM
jgi:hypothetical protein